MTPESNLVERVATRRGRLVGDLFDAWDELDVLFCIWKTSSLKKAFMGQSDFDILISQADAGNAERAFLEHGFIRVVGPDRKQMPAVEDWVGYDHDADTSYHFHVYFQLWEGIGGLAEYRLPWEARVLASRERDENAGGTWVIDPNLESILVVVRMALRANTGGAFWCAVRNKPYLSRLWDHLDQLSERTHREEVASCAADLLGSGLSASVLVGRLSGRAQGDKGFLSWARGLRSGVHMYSRFGRWRTRYHRLGLFVMSIFERFRRRLGVHDGTKCLHNGGRIIAIVGPDGAGKSTISKSLVAWLSWKIDAQYVYMGEGVGSNVTAWLRRLRRVARTTLRPLVRPKKANSESGDLRRSRRLIMHHGRNPLMAYLKANGFAVTRILLVWERRRKFRTLQRARMRGGLVITDRYPQSDFIGFYDGPRYQNSDANLKYRLSRLAANLEAAFYEHVGRMPPDLVVRLHVSEDVALARKPDHGLDMIRKKIEATPKICFGDARTIDVDAARPLAIVERQVKKWVWTNLQYRAR